MSINVRETLLIGLSWYKLVFFTTNFYNLMFCFLRQMLFRGEESDNVLKFSVEDMIVKKKKKKKKLKQASYPETILSRFV